MSTDAPAEQSGHDSADDLQRNLSNRHIQLIALGGEGAIDTVALDTFFDSFNPSPSPAGAASPASGAK